MSVLIKGMEMPTDCRDCPLEMYYMNVGETRCRATRQILAADYKTIPFEGRADNCPLIEIPPHGRLIDADALNDLINKSYPMTDRVDVHNGYAICQIMIKDLPTIIEAEEET